MNKVMSNTDSAKTTKTAQHKCFTLTPTRLNECDWSASSTSSLLLDDCGF